MGKSVITQHELMEKYPSIVTIELRKKNHEIEDVLGNRHVFMIENSIVVNVINKFGDVSTFFCKNYDQIEKIVKSYLDIVDNEL